MKFFTFLLFCGLFATTHLLAAQVTLAARDATVWFPKQAITGKVTGNKSNKITVYCNGIAYKSSIGADHQFKVSVTLKPGPNQITAVYNNASSRQLTLTLGYKPLPSVKPYATITGNKVTLNAALLNNPEGRPLTYSWSAEGGNPAACTIENKHAQSTIVQVSAADGTYYFNLSVSTGKDTAKFKTYVVRHKGSLHAFDMASEHAAWIDSAVIYEITPSVFVRKGSYDDITAKLPELKQLGINTIWLQPVYQTATTGQGYDVTDFFTLRDDLGTEAQLGNLIATAKKLQLKVIFDFVPNHTSVDHPYAQDCLKYGKSSHYYNFYQNANDGKKYSSVYHINSNGFVCYFWDKLVNLNYNNPEVQQWVIEGIKYWVNKYDIDGYRFDAMWGINSRNPEFSRRIRTELKSIKPGLLLLAEDKATDKTVFEKGFDLAYDWTPDTAWISQWSWQTHHDLRKSYTIFDFKDSLKRVGMMRKALFANANKTATLRFIENNDVPRFTSTHTLNVTKTAAALMFALPGIPMLYNGQEIGLKQYPYSSRPVFKHQVSIRAMDSLGYFPYYQKLISLRGKYPALRQSAMEELAVTGGGQVLALHRWQGDEHFVVIVNLDNLPANAGIDLGGNGNMPKLTGKAYLLDVLTGNTFSADNAAKVNVPMPEYGIKWLLIKQKG